MPEYDAVHARLGGDFNEARDARFQYANAHLPEAANAILNCLATARGELKNKSLYLATDAEYFKKIFSTQSKKRGLTVVTNGDKALHLSRPQRSDDVTQGFLHVFADLFLLARSRILVGSISGFSDLASVIGNPAYYSTHIETEICSKSL